ncbi:MAG: Asp-tRNA(Asn)/Glu-tRNA(Gln) amidotransferase subunit GatA [Candidatus Omnitrophica bacterium]|nr:Asp-tRNA(Asn)/Glu-tRNA(Gln) amidotransferase subunit GatA [Candidatus Omnitrophota bacterium]
MPTFQSGLELRDALAKGDLRPTEVVEGVLARIQSVDSRVGAFLRVYADAARRRAAELESTGPKGLLWGVPVALKDNLCWEGNETTCASRILEGFRPPYSAFVVRRLLEEGAVLMGQTNMDEFAFGSSTETSALGSTANPWDLGAVPGGSSGGSAASVSEGAVPIALGSDTGGSIRQPASFCGVVGLKPTYGRVSRSGLIAFSSSMDQIGPFSRTVGDSALALQVIAGHDPADSTSVNQGVPDYLKALGQGVEGLRIGIPAEYFSEGLNPEVEARVRESLEQLRSLGAEIVEITLPHTRYAVSTYYLTAPAEASSNLARFDGVQYGLRVGQDGGPPKNLLDMYESTRAQGFGAEAKRRILLGTYALSTGYYDQYYLKAQKVRTLIRKDFEEAFKLCDCVATPTSPTVAFKFGERTKDPLSMYLSDVFTIPANLSGVPAISIPCGFDAQGLPVGLQLLAPAFGEEILFRVGDAYERSCEWSSKQPDLS